MKKLCLLVCLSLGFVTSANAVGDAEAGKAKAATCAACHGADGNSVVDMYPKLAGQHAEYIIKQLHDFRAASKSGGEEGRNDPVMNGMAAPLSDQDIEDLAAYFSGQKAKEGTTPENVVEQGNKLFRGGDAEKRLAACAACHGPRGNGMGLAGFPDISGQHATYIKTQLEKFRSGARANDPNGMMQDIAKHLSDEDIEILSKYVGGLH
ncbi:c-type cytochrome [Neptunicella marina]|uniref:Cytochrome c4 n=1 Tax=Neptunicella marina TaxID=2125989 RepID=A0A8J6LZH2_9ALTE|nr:c-type cytochrome [Neptunicella marina]MBC3766629.1 cytochrome c4 [Neptunicella marina]